MAQLGEEFKGKVDESQKGEKEQQEQLGSQKEEKNVEQNEEKNKNQSQPQTLFGGLSSGQNFGQNLFNNSGINLKPGQLFTGNILSSSTQPSSELFSSLFNNNSNVEIKPVQPQPQIIQQAPKESDGSDDDDEDDLDEKYLQTEQKQEYAPNTELITKQDIEKFRKNANGILEQGTAAIEKANNGECYFFVYRNEKQEVVYAGQLIKGLSVTKPLGQKQENLLLKVLGKKESENQKEQEETTENKQFTIDTLKLMFKQEEGANAFKSELSKSFQ
ncbi:unnamed protein product (macronuclear) [Paramecium tetraurelia]|uniref:RanBD1 domain-containing protein n=1 Tax=Paramecium tetraurelia TaxID=5888 RepID=A0DDD5_PARTE|nr:uncharacterized protein GSPATT00015911001 [Paramecium tetraurelia]CAK81052.1 unnamed protein product [Paramecium tetraurelia]|eukprot:XP_001448449.1 hypothetical protein (macronuclear) [Paramecium tetraurelia strain d4-2]